MTERASIVILTVGVVLTVAAVLGLAVLAVAQGWLPPIASTGWTRVGWTVGAVAVGFGVGSLISVFHRPRAVSTGRPASAVAVPRHGRQVGHGAAPRLRLADQPTIQFYRPRVERFSTGRASAGGGVRPPAATRLLPCVPPERGGVAPAGGGREGWAAASPSTWTARGAATAAGLRTTTNE